MNSISLKVQCLGLVIGLVVNAGCGGTVTTCSSITGDSCVTDSDCCSGLACVSGSCVAADNPYDTCFAGDVCGGGTTCAETSLPVSSGASGNLCTITPCSADSDCVMVPTNYAAQCVNSQCYLTCPSSDTCPGSQSCVTFQDQNGNPINLCAP